MSLLKSHSKWCKTILCCQGLTGSTSQEEPDHIIMVLLGCHVQGGEPILGLDIDGGAVGQQDLDHLKLSRQ